MSETINNIHQASAATMLLPQSCEVILSGGNMLTVKRLSWIHFELLWNELAGLLAPLLLGSANTDSSASGSGGSGQFGEQLVAAPGCVLRLVSLCSGLSDSELAAMSCDDVLALGAAALDLNFVQGAGIRSFFAVLGQLA
jgi:hypothetical protein